MARQRDGARARTTDPSLSRNDGSNEGRPARPGSKPGAGLYLVATPIGNLRDITLRALDVLGAADVVACEDTRVTAKLLGLLGLSAPLVRYDEHSAATAGPALVARLKTGAVVALVSDAGTPLVSDPGGRLVRDCLAEGIAVTALPGPSAPLAALQLSGLPAERFLFAGFTPAKTTARRQMLAPLAAVPATLIFFESPNRLGDALADMAAVLGDRPAAVARELTKMHEEVVRDTLSALAARYAASGPPKGEVVVVVGPPGQAAPPPAADVEAGLRAAVAEGATLKDAAAQVAAESGLPRREVYALALKLFRSGNDA